MRDDHSLVELPSSGTSAFRQMGFLLMMIAFRVPHCGHWWIQSSTWPASLQLSCVLHRMLNSQNKLQETFKEENAMVIL